MQKSSFFAENEGEKGILDGYLFWSHKTCCATKKDIALETPDTTMDCRQNGKFCDSPLLFVNVFVWLF